MLKTILRKKGIGLVQDISGHSKLKKTLGVFDLIAIGIGVILGTGIFVVTGVNAATTAGPAILISFLIAGLTCIFAALVYTEVASTIPSSGGAYAYTYVALGEFFAWLVGWVSLTYLVSAMVAVASGWSGYVTGVLSQLNVHIPKDFTTVPSEGGVMNLPAACILLLMMLILVRGIRQSSAFNMLLVFVKIAAILIFLTIAVPHFDISNWSDFTPFGIDGVLAAAGSLFLAYGGFEVLANTAEEAKNPKRDITIALISAIIICAILYMAVSGVLTGIVSYKNLNTSEPLAYALRANGSNIGGAIVATGGIAGLTTVLLLQLYACSRIAMAMSRDGLLPKLFARIHPKFATPHVGTIFIGTIAAVLAGLSPTKLAGDMTSAGLIVAIVFVVISALVLRRTKPLVKRPFKCPYIGIVATIALVSCLSLLWKLLPSVGLILGSWMVLGVAIYFLYAKNKATLIYKNNH